MLMLLLFVPWWVLTILYVVIFAETLKSCHFSSNTVLTVYAAVAFNAKLTTPVALYIMLSSVISILFVGGKRPRSIARVHGVCWMMFH